MLKFELKIYRENISKNNQMIQGTIVRVSNVAQWPIVTYKCLLFFLYDFKIIIYSNSQCSTGKMTAIREKYQFWADIFYHNAL